MTLAVKFGDASDPTQLSGLIYLDAVTDYQRIHSGKVTEHPVEAGVSISDHYISNNPEFKITGVISGVDLSPISFSLNIDGQTPINAKQQPDAVSISDVGAGLQSFIPDSITQFLPSTSPTITGGSPMSEDYKDAVDDLLKEISNGIFYNEERERWENRMVLTEIIDVDDQGNLGNTIDNCILVNYTVTETHETGDGLFLELTFQKVRFAYLEKADAPAPRKGTSEDRGTKPTSEKGNVTPNREYKEIPRITSSDL